MGMIYERQLAIPAEVKEMYPLTAKMNKDVTARRVELESIFAGRSNKLILIIGPCSAAHGFLRRTLRNAGSGKIGRIKTEFSVGSGSCHAFYSEINGAGKHSSAVVIGVVADKIDSSGRKTMNRVPAPEHREKIAVR